mgnify:CR=1 FL=1
MSGESNETGSPSPGFFRRLYNGWLAIAGRFGMAQTLVILGFFYAFIIGPFAMGLTLARRDLLDKREAHGPGSAWGPADTAEPDLERTKQQF